MQGATHWDALGHLFYEDKAYNGYDAKLIDSRGLNVLGIQHSKNKMVGRGVHGEQREDDEAEERAQVGHIPDDR